MHLGKSASFRHGEGPARYRWARHFSRPSHGTVWIAHEKGKKPRKYVHRGEGRPKSYSEWGNDLDEIVAIKRSRISCPDIFHIQGQLTARHESSTKQTCPQWLDLWRVVFPTRGIGSSRPAQKCRRSMKRKKIVIFMWCTVYTCDRCIWDVA